MVQWFYQQNIFMHASILIVCYLQNKKNKKPAYTNPKIELMFDE